MKRKITIILCALALIFTLAIAANATYTAEVDDWEYEITSDISAGSTVTVTEDSYYGIKAKEAGYYLLEIEEYCGDLDFVNDIDRIWIDNFTCIFYMNKNQKIYMNAWNYDDYDSVDIKLTKLGSFKSYAVQKGKNEAIIDANAFDWGDNEVYIRDVPVDITFSSGKKITIEDFLCTYKGKLTAETKTVTADFLGKKLSLSVVFRNASYYIKNFSLPEDYTPTVYEFYDGDYYWDYPEYIVLNMTDGSEIIAYNSEYEEDIYYAELKNGKEIVIYTNYDCYYDCEEDWEDEYDYYYTDSEATYCFTVSCGNVEKEYDVAVENASFIENIQEYFYYKRLFAENVIYSIKEYFVSNIINNLAFLGFDVNFDYIYENYFW